MAELLSITCQRCGAANTVAAACSVCGRAFVITTAHLEGRLRTGRDEDPVTSVPGGLVVSLCDFDVAKGTPGVGPAAAVSAGLRQRTCPACRTEFLADHGL